MKRIFKTLLAVSLVFGVAAAGPAGGIGFPAGPQLARAEAGLPSSAINWLTELNAIYYNKLDDDDRADINAARQAMLDNEDVSLVEPLTDFLNANRNQGTDAFTNQEVAKLFWSVASALEFDTAYGLEDNLEILIDNFNNARFDVDVRSALAHLLEASGVPLDGQDDLDPSHLAEFLEELRAELFSVVDPVDVIDFLYFSGSSDADLKATLKANFKDALEEVIGNSNLRLSVVLAAYGNTNDLADATMRTALNFAKAYDAGFDAVRAIVKGYVLMGITFSSTVSNEGLTRVPKLTVYGMNVPNDLVKWEVVSSADNMISFSNGAFRLPTSAASNVEYSAQIRATARIVDIVLYEGQLKMTYTPAPPPQDPVVTPPASPAQDEPNFVAPPEEEQQQQLEELGQTIQDTAQQLAEAAPEERGSIIMESVNKAKETLKNISVVTLIAPLNPVSGKATVPMAEDDIELIKEQIQKVAQETANVNQSLQELDPNAIVKPVLTFDLGTVEAAAIEMNFVEEVLEAAKEAGVEVSVTVNGASIVFDPNEFDGETTLTIQPVNTDNTQNAGGSGTGNRVVSGAYDFTFTMNNTGVSQFDKPVQLRIPVQTGNTDPDLLALAKLAEDGSVEEYKTGVLNGDTYVGFTSTLSTYAIVENPVAFDDTASVESWAGRAIRSIAAKGIVEGRRSGVFDPGANVTRAEFAKMLAKAAGIHGTSATETFDDVTETDWFQPYVAVLQKWGITNGRGSTKIFAPHEFITRAEIATMIARTLELVNGQKSYSDAAAVLGKFKDQDVIHDTLKAGVAFAADYEIVRGKPGNVFDPNSYATRAEAAVMIYRMIHYLE